MASRQQQQAAAAPAADPPNGAAGGGGVLQQAVSTALVDPSDPTKLYLTQPLDPSQQRPDAPAFPSPLV